MAARAIFFSGFMMAMAALSLPALAQQTTDQTQTTPPTGGKGPAQGKGKPTGDTSGSSNQYDAGGKPPGLHGAKGSAGGHSGSMSGVGNRSN